MADVIDRDAVLHDVSTECSNAHEAKYYEAQVALTRAKRIIRDAPAVNRWIPCEDELPERDTNVLIYYPEWQDAPVQTAHIMSDGSCWEFSDGEFYPSMKDITHWMPLPPLPEPPEKE